MTPETRNVLLTSLSLTTSQIRALLRLEQSVTGCTLSQLASSLHISQDFVSKGLVTMSMLGLTIQAHHPDGKGGHQIHWKLATDVEAGLTALAKTVQVTGIPSDPSIPQYSPLESVQAIA
jgi:predicted transcriptional regulator